MNQFHKSLRPFRYTLIIFRLRQFPADQMCIRDSYIGIKPFRYLALSMPVTAMDLLLPGSGSAFRACVVGGLMTVMGIGSLCLIGREVKYGSRLGK